MARELDLVQKLIESAADGTEINWDDIDHQVDDPDVLRLMQHLRVVAGVAELHRSQLDDDAAPRDESLTRPATSPAPASLLGRQTRGAADPAAGRHRVSGPADPEPLGRWGHLLLVRKIGEGAFGEVYHAHDTWLDHPVALKLLKSSKAKPDLSNQILHEARRLARVRHPNVVTVHGADNHDGRVGFWMDLIEGRTLSELVAQGRLSSGEAIHIGQELCLALAAVHGARLIHRDVKAQNVMRASDGGRIILMDFGAGEFIDQTPGASRIGTPLYLAPELWAGGTASVRSDIYSLGVLLFFLVTGTFPVQGTSVAELTEAHSVGERQRLRDIRPDLPDFFVTIVERALAADPARRFASAGEMHAALAREPGSTFGLLESSVPPSAVRPPTSWQQRALRAGGAVMAIVLGLTLVGFITSTGYNRALGLEAPYRQESFLAWPLWGFRAMLLPGVVVVGLMSVGLILVTTFYRVLMLTSPRQATEVADELSQAAARVRDASVATTAPLLFVLQGTLIALSWWWFAGFLSGLDSLITQASGGDLSALGPANKPEQQFYRQALSIEFFGFAFGWAALIWSKVRRDDPGGWVSIAGGLMLTVMTLAALVFPYRILSHSQHQRVRFRSQVCYLLSERGNEGLLFCPLQEPPRNRVVRLDDRELEPDGPVESVFSQLRDVR
jgi:tRNA A-37 threonylcarbamoyl transferase component Bud32